MAHDPGGRLHGDEGGVQPDPDQPARIAPGGGRVVMVVTMVMAAALMAVVVHRAFLAQRTSNLNSRRRAASYFR